MKATTKKRLLYAGLAIAGTAICVAFGARRKPGFNYQERMADLYGD